VGDLPVPSTTFEDRSRQQEEWRADRRAGLSRTHELELNFDASTRTAPGREGLMHTNQNEVSAPELNRACDGRTNPGLPHTHERRAGSETVHGELKGWAGTENSQRERRPVRLMGKKNDDELWQKNSCEHEELQIWGLADWKWAGNFNKEWNQHHSQSAKQSSKHSSNIKQHMSRETNSHQIKNSRRKMMEKSEQK
jgi:hypothetical protein